MKLVSIKVADAGGPLFRVSLVVCNRVGIGLTSFWHLRPRWFYCGVLPARSEFFDRPRQLVLRVLWFGIGIRLRRSPC